MSTTHGPIERTGTGAVPQPPPALVTGPGDTPDPFARSGDTDVVFRLERDVPVVGRLRELTAEISDRLADNWRMVAAVGVGLLALGFLATVVGGAYGHRTPAAPAPAAALPSPPPPLPTAPVPAPVPALAATAEAPVAPARPVRMRTHPARAGAKKAAHATPRHRPGTAPAHHPR